MHVYSDPYPIQFGSGDWITVVTNATGTFTGEMTLPDGTVIPPTGKAFDVELGQTTEWEGDQLVLSPPSMTPPCSGSSSASPSREGRRPARGRSGRASRRIAAWLEGIAPATAGPSAQSAACDIEA